MRHHGFLAITAAMTVAAVGWFLNQGLSLDASEENRSFREVFRGDDYVPVEDETGIRLNYFESNWDRVLVNVAEQADLRLVMDKIPHGRYARRDRKRYRIDSAIRILNAELEKQGFRLLQQANHLIVLKLDNARTRYARPALSDWKNADQPQQPVSPFAQISNRKDNSNDGARLAWASQQQAAQQQQLPNTQEMPPEPQQSDFAASVKPRVAQQAAVDEGPLQRKTIALRHSKAADVAKSIYLVFESRSELQRDGLGGLPTFIVKDKLPENVELSVEPKVLFRIGIDQAQNSLIVESTVRRAGHLARLVSELDKPTEDPADQVRLLPNNGMADVTAQELNEQIHRLVAMQGQQPPNQLQQRQMPSDTTGQTPFPGIGQPQQQPEGALNLRGDVNVQAIQDLGVIVLRGNEEDVAKVERIIQQLEQMSVGSLPQIHLLELQFVNSEALAELMTNVFAELAEVRARGEDTRKTASFVPVVQPNALLIMASQIDLKPILDLADKLDKQTDPGTEFSVFPLKNAIASQVATNISSFYDQRGGLGTRVRVIADARTNSLVVQGRSNDLTEIAKLIEKIDRDSPDSVHRVEIVELQHATATELADTINNAIQSTANAAPQPTNAGGGFGAGQQNQDLQGTKSVALEFLATTAGGRELIRSGILVDVRINADARSNSLLISAPEASMPLLLALVEQLDKVPTAISEIKVFTLENADAEQAVELLTTIFENQNNEDQVGVVLGGTEDGPSSLIPVQFSADARTNTVVAVGGAEALSVVEALLLRLDSTEAKERITQVIPVRNAQASIIATAVSDFLDQQQDFQDSADGLVSNIERLRNEVLIAPDDNSNTLIISASPEYFSQVTSIIRDLDANPPQVVIQALIVEVQLDNTDEFGVELGFQDPTLFARSILEDASDLVTTTEVTQNAAGNQVQSTIIQSSDPTPGFLFNNTGTPLGNNGGAGSNPGTVAAQGLSNFSLGRQNSDLGFGGFVFSAQSEAVSVLVRALAARRTLHVLSRPQIRTTHNNEASIEVGQQLQVTTGVNIINNVVSPQTEEQSVGIILRVNPRVTNDGTIFMDVFAERSSISPIGTPIFVDATTGNVIEAPIIDQALADTSVAVRNGQTVVIGGMITKSDETLERKVPWLGDLPIIGNAFRYDGTNTVRTELLIFLTPRVIYGESDEELIKQVEAERIHLIESEAEEIHGPIYSVPSNPYQGAQYLDQQYDTEQVLDPVNHGFGPAQPVNEAPLDAGDAEIILPPSSQGRVQPSHSRDRHTESVSARSSRSAKVIPASRQQPAGEASRIKQAGWVDRLLRRKQR